MIKKRNKKSKNYFTQETEDYIDKLNSYIYSIEEDIDDLTDDLRDAKYKIEELTSWDDIHN